MAKGKLKRCNCVEQVNLELEKYNACLRTKLIADFKTREMDRRIVLPLSKRDSTKKSKLPTVLCTYCPICGIKLED